MTRAVKASSAGPRSCASFWRIPSPITAGDAATEPEPFTNVEELAVIPPKGGREEDAAYGVTVRM